MPATLFFHMHALAICLTSGWTASDPSIFYREAKDSVVTLLWLDGLDNLNVKSQGTAFFIKDNWILTNYHVAADQGFAQMPVPAVLLADGQYLSLNVAKVIFADAEKDLAIIDLSRSSSRFDAPNQGDFLLGLGGPVAAMPKALALSGDREVDVGETIYVIGSPLGFAGTLSTGIVSASRDKGYSFQFSAPISPGSSGSPIFGADGLVLGIVTSQARDGQLINFGTRINNIEFEANDLGRLSDWAAKTITDREQTTSRDKFSRLKKSLVQGLSDFIASGDDSPFLSVADAADLHRKIVEHHPDRLREGDNSPPLPHLFSAAVSLDFATDNVGYVKLYRETSALLGAAGVVDPEISAFVAKSGVSKDRLQHAKAGLEFSPGDELLRWIICEEYFQQAIINAVISVTTADEATAATNKKIASDMQLLRMSLDDLFRFNPAWRSLLCARLMHARILLADGNIGAAVAIYQAAFDSLSLTQSFTELNEDGVFYGRLARELVASMRDVVAADARGIEQGIDSIFQAAQSFYRRNNGLTAQSFLREHGSGEGSVAHLFEQEARILAELATDERFRHRMMTEIDTKVTTLKNH